MSRPIKLLLIGLALFSGVWLGYTKLLSRMYLEPRAALLQRIESTRTTLATYRKNRDDHQRVLEQLQQFIDRTLGGDLEAVDAKLRSRLWWLGEQANLQKLSVVTFAMKPKESPAKSLFTGTANRPLQAELDFCELDSRISGECSFEQALQLIDSIEAEPWIKRIDQLKLDPRDNGDRFSVTIHLTTFFLPAKLPNPEHAPAVTTSNLDRYAALVRANPFRLPPAQPASDRRNTAAATSEPAQFPYQQWWMTGVTQSSTGAEIWLLNQQTRESRILRVGESLQDAVLVAASGDAAEFRMGDERFTIAVGRNLSDRTSLSQ